MGGEDEREKEDEGGSWPVPRLWRPSLGPLWAELADVCCALRPIRMSAAPCFQTFFGHLGTLFTNVGTLLGASWAVWGSSLWPL
eukprot:7620043-Pyramimonas_sp.AAC.1